MKLSIDFAFAGFDIIRKHPVAVLLWGVAAMVFGLLTTVLMVAMAGPALMALQAQGETPSADPSQVFGRLGAMAPVWLIAIVIGLLSGTIIQCAVFRSQLRPKDGGLGFMKLGGDEVRQAVVSILYFLAFMIFYVLFVLVVSIVIGLLAAITSPLGNASGIIAVILVVVAFVAFFYIMSRWSLVLVQSYDERKINIFGSLKLTKGAGWTLFFGYFLLGIVVIIAAVVIYAILFGATMGASLGSGGDLTSALRQMGQRDMSSVAALFTVSFLIQTLVGGLLSGVAYALMYGASVSAYRTLATKNTSKADLF
jgi:hypothetical protein